MFLTTRNECNEEIKTEITEEIFDTLMCVALVCCLQSLCTKL